MRDDPTSGGVRLVRDGAEAESPEPLREAPGDEASGGADQDTASLLKELLAIVQGAKSMPLSNSILVNRDEILEVVHEAINRLPRELFEARLILREREDYLARAQREAEKLIEAGQAQAARLVERTDIMRRARETAQRVVDEAQAEANRLRLAAEDYCDQRLGAFEALLDRTMKAVQGGRKKLADRISPSGEITRLATGESPVVDNGFFDQDRVP